MAGSYKYTPIGEHPRSRKAHVFACAAALIVAAVAISSWSGQQTSELALDLEERSVAPLAVEPSIAHGQQDTPASVSDPLQKEDPAEEIASVEDEEPVVSTPVEADEPAEGFAPIQDEEPIVSTPVEADEPAEVIAPIEDEETVVSTPVEADEPAEVIAPIEDEETVVSTPVEADEPAEVIAPIEDEETVVNAPIEADEPAEVIAPIEDEETVVSTPIEADEPAEDITPIQNEEPDEVMAPVKAGEPTVTAPVEADEPVEVIEPVEDENSAVVFAPVGDEEPAAVAPAGDEPAAVIAPIDDYELASVNASLEYDGDFVEEEDPLAKVNDGTFELYKLAVSSRAGGSEAIREIVGQTIAVVNSTQDLGCGGVEVSAFPFGPRLDWVESSVLANDPSPIEEWQSYFEFVNADMSQFNAFMHNKITMYVPDLDKPLAQLLSLNGTGLMLRRSANYSDGKQLGHVSFEIAGRVYEIVGETTEDEWPEWNEEECPAAHRLDDDLDRYARAYESFVENADEATNLWAQERGYYPPMVAMVSVATAESSVDTLRSTLFEDLEDIAGVEARVEEEDESGCAVYRLDFNDPQASVAVRYIVNSHANSILEATGLNRSVSDFDEYILSTHEMITGSFDRWDGWDHWLDQHVGLRYVGDDSGAIAHTLNARFSDRNLSVAQRTTGEDEEVHWYAGYAGSSAWEFVTDDSLSFSLNQAGPCACVASNNNLKYFEKTGYTNCTGAAVEDPELDGEEEEEEEEEVPFSL